ncbi:hypothetical protein Mterra_04088 [Calidithermus terrae]|uniref:Right handed beta helix region n=1 Tax=Calidithermus terrae TaxID=1408545 RepID=A0A399DQJ4_9DEIN|nr:hypothetical protein Mterra_04088 [Calidithermus terrae]
MPTRLVNSGARCDYLVDGFIEVNSRLEIEPGTLLRFTKDSELNIDGGELIAVGTPAARIRMEGLNPVTGYWSGIIFGTNARPSRIEYVDIVNAGQEGGYYHPKGALAGFGGSLVLKHSTISGSYVNGAIFRSLRLIEFENNRFFGNTWYGVVIDPAQVHLLDAASDYAGREKPNGRPYVGTGLGDLEEDVTWKKLNAPYFVEGYLNVAWGTLTLAPGVKLVFSDKGNLTVEETGALRAVGTAAEPVVFTGKEAVPGYWAGIWFFDSTSRANKLEHVDIGYAGGESILGLNANVVVDFDAYLSLSHANIHHSQGWGVRCGNPEVDGYVLELGPGNTFSHNAGGDVDPDCG